MVFFLKQKMESSKYPVFNYVPYKPTKHLEGSKIDHDLGYTLDKHKYEAIISNPKYHFRNCYVTNFDIIHNECRGSELSHSKKFYNSISYNKLNKEIPDNHSKNSFISSAIKSERNEVLLEKEVLKEHFIKQNLEQKLEKYGVFLSSMKKRAFLKKMKYTDDCKSLFKKKKKQ